MSGPEDNPADEHQPTKEEWENAMQPAQAPGHGETEATCKTCLGAGRIRIVAGDEEWTEECMDCQPAQAPGHGSENGTDRETAAYLDRLLATTDPAQETGRGEGGAVHELKTWPVYFNALLDGSKTFEVRIADRPFKVGDTLWLREYCAGTPPVPSTLGYTGREMRRTVTYILAEPSPFAFPGYVVMGLSRASQPAASGPIPMILPCPKCGLLHVDAPEPEKGWTNPPHKSHLCHGCGIVWRPADVETIGVAAITTTGSKDTWKLAASGGGEGAEATEEEQERVVIAMLSAIGCQITHRRYGITHADLERMATAAIAALSRGKGKA